MMQGELGASRPTEVFDVLVQGKEQKFACPSDFVPCPFTQVSSFTKEKLNSSSTELWLIKAPLDFNPASFNSKNIPLIGFQSVKVKNDGKKRFYNIFSSPRETGASRLIVPSAEEGRMLCGPPFQGYISISDSFGEHGSTLHTIPASPALQIPEGLKQRFQPFGATPPVNSNSRNGAQVDNSEPAEGGNVVKKRKKKKKNKKHSEEVDMLACIEQEDVGAVHWGNSTEIGPDPEEGAELQDLHIIGATTKKRKKKKRKKEQDDVPATALEIEDDLEDEAVQAVIEEVAETVSDETSWTVVRKKKRKRPSHGLQGEDFEPTTADLTSAFKKKKRHIEA
ncbi:DNA-directed RNA polymerase I subunit RPA34 [Ambystoma mexicanum]|uniref:DNA-directed RNA polymerase I subunit RPA34 n=1 Tax=Ambystoma mexicanum TaxID=8296 RepID=UPI0037E8E42D